MSELTATREKAAGKETLRYYLRIIGTLFVITAAVAVLLALVNRLTRPTIERRAEEKRVAAMAAVLPDAQRFSQMPFDRADGRVVDVQGGIREDTIIGYCVQVTTNGFGGAIDMMVGVDSSGAVTGVEILSMSETAGLGARADEPEFREQFLGRAGTIQVKTGDNAIVPISGATITSKAVTEGVNAALDAVAHLDTEGGADDNV